MKPTKKDKGVAGLTLLLSVITSIFVIGLLVMIFALMGAELKDETQVRSGNVSVVNETVAVDGSSALAAASLDDPACIIHVVENTTQPGIVASGNYSVADCYISNSTSFYSGNWNVTYSYYFDNTTTASSTIENTTTSISGVTEWFPIFIVITAMVVLILLTVIIITSIRGSGLMGQGGSQEGSRGGDVGTA